MNSASAGYITDIPYTDNYFAQLSPVMINCIGALNGFPSPSLDAFSYCELGCGYGLSLLLHAAAYPQGKFYGIDLNTDHITHAKRVAAEAGISNLELIAEPVSKELAESGLPQFDFIAMHGLYTWVSPKVRKQLCEFIESRLKPGGFVFVSYNAMPGSSSKEPLREMMRHFANPLSNNSLERVQLGLAYLKLMLDSRAPFFEINQQSKLDAEHLLTRDLNYIAHEFFHESWHPLYFSTVNNEMAEAGLTYTGSFPIWENFPEADVPTQCAPFFSQIKNRTEREAHKDFFRNTVFRYDLFTKLATPGTKHLNPVDAMWNMPFGCVHDEAQIDNEKLSGFIVQHLAGKDSQVVLSALRAKPRTMRELAEHPDLRHLPPTEIFNLVTRWLATEQIQPTAGIPAAPSGNGLSKTNIGLIRSSLTSKSNTHVYLASRQFGTAFKIPQSLALALWAASEAGEQDRAAALLTLLDRLNLTLFDDGDKPLSADQRLMLCKTIFSEMDQTGQIELARSMGIFQT
jgi:SAM-dependent methyltransferase